MISLRRSTNTGIIPIVNSKNELLSRAAGNAYATYCRDDSNKQPRKPYVDEKILEHIDLRHKYWEDTKNAAQGFPFGWPNTLSRIFKQHKVTGGDYQLIAEHVQPSFPNHTTGALTQLVHAWNKWKTHNGVTRKLLRDSKTRHVDQLIDHLGEPQNESNIWKAIDQISPAPRKVKRSNHTGVQREDGTWC